MNTLTKLFLWVVSVGVCGVLLLHVYLLRLASHDEYLGNIILEDVLVGDECLHFTAIFLDLPLTTNT
jgi:hypothetical protein